MCGILGVGFLPDHTMAGKEKELLTFVETLFTEAQVRGRISTGVAVASTNNIFYMKKKLPASKFIRTEEFVELMKDKVNLSNDADRTFSIIGHCRLDTKGTPDENVNNHPIICDNIVGIHNGQITNDDSLFKLYTPEFQRIGKVDSEIIFQLINYYYEANKKRISNPHVSPTVDAIRAAAQKTTGSMACACINKQDPSMLYLFRTWNPLQIKYYTKLGMIVFCSDDMYINRAFVKAGFSSSDDENKILYLQADNGMVFDLQKNSYRSFSLQINT